MTDVGFTQIGGLQDETVDSRPLLQSFSDAASTFAQGREKAKRQDKLDERADIIREDAAADVRLLEGQIEGQSDSPFREASEDNLGEDNTTRQLRRQGGSAAIKAQLRSRKALLSRLSTTSPENVEFVLERYRARGGQESADQFLASQAQAKAKATQDAADNIADVVKNELGIDMLVEDPSEFVRGWQAGDPRFDNIKTVLSQTSDRKLKELSTQNNFAQVNANLNTWLRESMGGNIDELLSVGANTSRPEVEARNTESLTLIRGQLENKLQYVKDSDQRAAILATYDTLAKQATRIADGSATRDELATMAARNREVERAANVRKMKAEEKLAGVQAASEELETVRKMLDNADKASDILQGFNDKVLLSQSRGSQVDPSTLNGVERYLLENPTAQEGFNKMLFGALDGVMESTGGGAVDIGTGGTFEMPASVKQMEPTEAVEATGALIASLSSGVDPFGAEGGAAGLQSFMQFGAQKVNQMSPAERKGAFDKLSPLMNTSEFAQMAANNPRAFKPWVNLVIAETQQRGANMLGGLSRDLINDTRYKRALTAAQASNETRLDSIDARRAVLNSKPEVLDRRLARPLSALSGALASADADGPLAEFVLGVEGKGADAYLRDMGVQQFEKEIARPILRELKSNEDLNDQERAVARDGIRMAREHYDNLARITRDGLMTAENAGDLYKSMNRAVRVDEEALDRGEYKLRVSPEFEQAFKGNPEMLNVVRQRVQMHNGGDQVKAVSSTLGIIKNVNGFQDIRGAYDMFRSSRVARPVSALLPSFDPVPTEGGPAQ